MDAERRRRNEHTCHAMRCEVRVPPAMFMCKRHWYMLPKATRGAVWVYLPGQEIRMDPSDEYLTVARDAVLWLAKREGFWDEPIGAEHG